MKEKADLYFKVYGTSSDNADGSHRQDVLTKVADGIIERVGPDLLYHRFSDAQIKDLGLTVDEIDGLRSFMSITPVELGYDITCKHGTIGYMPEHVVKEYEELASKYKKKTVDVTLSGGKAKFYSKWKRKICTQWSDYEAKCHVVFKEPV